MPIWIGSRRAGVRHQPGIGSRFTPAVDVLHHQLDVTVADLVVYAGAAPRG